MSALAMTDDKPQVIRANLRDAFARPDRDRYERAADDWKRYHRTRRLWEEPAVEEDDEEDADPRLFPVPESLQGRGFIQSVRVKKGKKGFSQSKEQQQLECSHQWQHFTVTDRDGEKYLTQQCRCCGVTEYGLRVLRRKYNVRN